MAAGGTADAKARSQRVKSRPRAWSAGPTGARVRYKVGMFRSSRCHDALDFGDPRDADNNNHSSARHNRSAADVGPREESTVELEADQLARNNLRPEPAKQRATDCLWWLGTMWHCPLQSYFRKRSTCGPNVGRSSETSALNIISTGRPGKPPFHQPPVEGSDRPRWRNLCRPRWFLLLRVCSRACWCRNQVMPLASSQVG